MKEGTWLTQKNKKPEMFGKKEFYQFHVCNYLGNISTRTYLFILKE